MVREPSAETLTILIPTYNRPDLLRVAIESALDADEVIVYDNGSTDNTEQVARSYPVTYVRGEVNTGTPTTAINHGIDNAKSDWLYLVADDDFLLPGSVARIRQHLYGDMVFSDLYLGDINGIIRSAWQYAERKPDPEWLLSFAREHRTSPIPMVGPFRLKWIRDNGLHFITWPHTGYAEDCRTFIEWATHSPEITYVPGPFHVYRRHDGQGAHLGAERDQFLADLDAYFKGE